MIIRINLWFCLTGVGITLAVVAAVIFLLLGLCCCWLVRLVGRHIYYVFVVFFCTATILYNVIMLFPYVSCQYHSCVPLHVSTGTQIVIVFY